MNRYDLSDFVKLDLSENFKLSIPKRLIKNLQQVFDDYKIVTLSGFSDLVKVVYDCGANFGAFSILMRMSYPDARIICYEPDPYIFQLLSQYSQMYNFEAHNEALSDYNGKAILWKGNEGSYDNSLIPNPCTGRGCLEVNISAPENHEIEQIDVIKIDTEGSEVPILSSVLKKFYPWCVYLEYHSEADRVELDSMLRERYILIGATTTQPYRGQRQYLAKDFLYRFPKIQEIEIKK